MKPLEIKLIPIILVVVLPPPFVPRILFCDAGFRGQASASSFPIGHALVIIEISGYLKVSILKNGK